LVTISFAGDEVSFIVKAICPNCLEESNLEYIDIELLEDMAEKMEKASLH
jgi:hypothetical protein